jgi:hypothetical protein
MAMGILTTDMQLLIRQHKLGWVATVCPDGTPNLSPKGTTMPWGDDAIVFADLHSPGTVANVAGNPAMELGVVDQWTRKGYRFKGRAETLESGPEFSSIVEAYRRAGTAMDKNGEPRFSRVVVLRVERALPLVSPAYDWGASEAEITANWVRYWDQLNAER